MIAAQTNIHLGRMSRDDDQSITDVVRVERLRLEHPLHNAPENTTYTVRLGTHPTEVVAFIEEADLFALAKTFSDAAIQARRERERAAKEAS